VADIPLCSPPDRNPRQAAVRPPAGTVDCHVHVFAAEYPLSPARGYTPRDASLDELRHMHAQLGIDRAILVQPSVYGTDNSAVLDALAGRPDRARAVVALSLDVSDDDLADLDTRGVRGIRLNLADPGGMPISRNDIAVLASRIADLGWHLEFLFDPSELGELAPTLRSVPVPISIGHFGYVGAAAGVDSAPFRILCDLVAEGNTWLKLSAPYRLGVGDLPPWTEVAPLAEALVAVDSSRLLWATDWPHPNRFGPVPNDADLLEQFYDWVPDPGIRHQILVDNPAAFYRF
jgi:predicted TIM-barrel fold metal-dependent hydrolase